MDEQNKIVASLKTGQSKNGISYTMLLITFENVTVNGQTKNIKLKPVLLDDATAMLLGLIL
jgi:hypothetical protein